MPFNFVVTAIVSVMPLKPTACEILRTALSRSTLNSDLSARGPSCLILFLPALRIAVRSGVAREILVPDTGLVGAVGAELSAVTTAVGGGV